MSCDKRQSEASLWQIEGISEGEMAMSKQSYTQREMTSSNAVTSARQSNHNNHGNILL